MEEYLLFLLSFENNPNPKCKNSLILRENFIIYDEIDLQKIHVINNDLIKYIYEIKDIQGEKNFNYFPLYYPLEDKCYFYLM